MSDPFGLAAWRIAENPDSELAAKLRYHARELGVEDALERAVRRLQTAALPEPEALRRALTEANGQVRGAAAWLGWAERTFTRTLSEYPEIVSWQDETWPGRHGRRADLRPAKASRKK